MEKAQKEAVVKGKGVFGGVLGREEMEEGE